MTNLKFVPYSAILYLNDNFDGGELFFTNRDAKTVTVSHLVPLRFFQLCDLIRWIFVGSCKP